MKQMKKLINKKTLLNVSLAGILYTQISHTAFLYSLLSHEGMIGSKADGTIAGVVIEAAVFMFTLYRNKLAVILFAILSVITNLFYYLTPEHLADMRLELASIFFSLVIPTCIFFYSELYEKVALQEKAHATYLANKERKLQEEAVAKKKRNYTRKNQAIAA